MKLISWNVAGYRACLKKGFADFFEAEDADIFCLQEVKASENQITYHPEGYFAYLNEAEKKGYSGTMIYTKQEPLSIHYGMGIAEHDREGRIITLEYPLFYLVTVYTPNSKRELERLDYRMQWEADFLKYIQKLEEDKLVVICGDMNVAHQEIDIENPKQNERNAGFTVEERDCFSRLLGHRMIDTYRHFHPTEEGAYTWWSYFYHSRERNIGWRLDYFLVSEDLLPWVEKTKIYSDVLGSDHCPIGLELKDMEVGSE